MPNSRRRKFSVKHNFKSQRVAPLLTEVQGSISNENIQVKTSISNCVIKANSREKVCINTNTLKPSCHEKKSFNKTSNIILTTAKHAVTKADKDVTASISSRELRNLMASGKPPLPCCDKSFSTNKDMTRPSAETSKQKALTRRERQLRQHRIKIRGPRPRNLLSDEYQKIKVENTIGVNTEEIKLLFGTSPTECFANAYLSTDRNSSESVEDMCRICHGGDTLSQELGSLISACSCRGTVGRVHVKCLERWLTESGKSRCELCGITYVTRRVHRYGVPRALVMWILSQNTKQLMVDTLGIMLMSPLAVLAAWLSGKTLATLISQENHTSPAPWPLASTFVLACMTLVCYYCWIVSAATRHALSWWIWYRSQYEVRLQLNSDGED